MELIRKELRYIKEGKKIFDQFYLDEDINVPDTKEDVRQIVKGNARVKVEEMKPVENYLKVSGKLYYQILYITESEVGKPAVLEGKLLFEEMIYREDQENATWVLENVRTDFSQSLIHSRKLSVRATIELEIGKEILENEETTVDADGTETIYKKKKNVNLLCLQTVKKDTYRIKEEITLSGTKESIGQILMTDIDSRKLEIRVDDGEISFQGELMVFFMYLSEEGKTDWMESTIQYEGKIACEGVESGMYYHAQHSLEDTLADVRLDEDGEMRVIGIEGTLVLRMNIYREEEMELLEDLYVPGKETVFDVQKEVYEELLIQNHSKCKVTERLVLPELKDNVLQICHSEGNIQVEHMEVVEEGIAIEGILHVSFLYLCVEDSAPFGSWQGMIPFNWTLECPDIVEDMKYNISYYPEQLSVVLAGSEAVDVKAVLAFDTFVRKPVFMDVINRVELKDIAPDKIKKAPGVIGYVVKEGDQLWDLAKKYMTTTESIKKTNELESEHLKNGDILLIFKENPSIL